MVVTDPVWRILREDGRHMGWLARRTGYSHNYVRAVACGVTPTTPQFRQRCAEAMNLPEAILFWPRASSDPTTAANGSGNNQSA